MLVLSRKMPILGSYTFLFFSLLCSFSTAWEPMEDSVCRSEASGTKWIVTKDCDVSQKAKETAKKECVTSDEEVDRVRGREILEDAAEPNLIRENLESAQSSDEFKEGVQSDYEAQTQSIAMSKGFSIIVGFVLIGCFNLCCWTMCPSGCCQKLRCGAKEHGEAKKLIKIGVFVLWFGLILGCLVSAMLAMTGKGNIEKGLDRFVCASSEMASYSLSGKKQDGDNFMGMLPILLHIDSVVKSLKPGGPFNTEVTALLDLTVAIERSVGQLSATLKLLTNTVGLSENVKPENDLTGQSLEHTCIYCEQVGEKMTPVVQELDESLGTALNDARAQVKDQLSGEKSEELAGNLEEKLEPVRENADLVRDNVGQASEMGETKDQIKAIFGQVITLLTVLVFPLMICGCISTSCWAIKERAPDDATNPYNKHVRNAACLGCCYGTWYIAIVLIIAGVLNAITQPVASICLIVADINGDNLQKWSPALGVETDDEKKQNFDIVDTCLTEKGTGDIFNVLTVKVCPRGADDKRPSDCNESEKEELTVRAMLVGELQFEINKAFDEIEKKDTGVPKTSEQAGFDTLLKFLETPLDSLTFFSNPDKMAQDPKYAGFASPQQSVQEIAAAAFGTHARCDDFQYDTAEFPEIQEYVNMAVSVNDFRSKVVAGGFATGSTTDSVNCVDALTCTSSVDPVKQAVCDASNEILKLKRNLKSSFNFRCDMLYTPSAGRPGCTKVPGESGKCWCDPKDMKKKPNGEWMQDCLVLDPATNAFVGNTMKKTCGYEELVQYVADFKDRIKNSADNLDDSVVTTKDEIVTDLRRIVNKHVFDTVTELIDGINCKYMYSGITKVVDGLCFQTVRGVSEVAHAYTALGALGVIVVVFLYCMFRWSADNINKWVPPKAAAQPGPPAAAAEPPAQVPEMAKV
jgi:hypothetical protein